jgi:hypothetical protein
VAASPRLFLTQNTEAPVSRATRVYHAIRGIAATTIFWMQVYDLAHHVMAAMPRFIVTAALLLP